MKYNTGIYVVNNTQRDGPKNCVWYTHPLYVVEIKS